MTPAVDRCAVSMLPESVVAMEVESQGLEEEEEQLFLDVLDADERFARRLYQVALQLPGSLDGLPARRSRRRDARH